MTPKKPWYDLVMDHLNKAAEDRFFPENSIRGEIEGAKIGLCLSILRNGKEIPRDVAPKIVSSLNRLTFALDDSRQFHLSSLAQEVMDDLTSQINGCRE